MGIEALNCQCACEENPGESYIFDGVSDYYFPIKRKKSKIKSFNSFFCNACKKDKDLEKLQEINVIKNNKMFSKNQSSLTLENSQNFYNKRTSLNSNYNIANSSYDINNINNINNSNYLYNLEVKFDDDLDIQMIIIIYIQSNIRGWLYRKNYKLKIKQELIDIENNLIKKSLEKFTNNNIKLSEETLGKFNKDNWKQYYKIGDKLFSKESRTFIAEKYNLKNILNNFYNFDFKSLDNINFLIDDLDEDDTKNNDKINYELLKTAFYSPKEASKIFLTKLKFFNLIEENIYIGSVNIEGEKYGYGKLIQKNGNQFEGNWRNGGLEGWGRITEEDGGTIEGYFINGRINGKGIIKKLNGYTYEGDFFKGMKEGYGKEENNKIIYEGQFHKNLKCGKGVCYFKLLDDKYEGEFDNNVINGKGVYVWNKEGNYFKGNFINGQMDGIGLFVWKDGSKYYGNYKNNVKEGKGKFIWPDGKCFEGNFVNGKPHGKGLIIIKDEKNKIISSDEVEYDNGKLIS